MQWLGGPSPFPLFTYPCVINRFIFGQEVVIYYLYFLQLLDDIMCLLDSLAVWDVQSGAGWQEMVHLGLSILLTFAKHDSLNVSLNPL